MIDRAERYIALLHPRVAGSGAISGTNICKCLVFEGYNSGRTMDLSHHSKIMEMHQ